MIRWLLRLCERVAERKRQPGQSCATCRWLGDFFDPAEDDPSEVNDYCEYPDQPEQAPYGGHWVHRDSWCNRFSPTVDGAGRQETGK